MTRPWRRALASISILAFVAACSSGAADTDDRHSGSTSTSASTNVTVVVNAQVYTVDPARSWADSFAYDADGVIVAVGTEAEVHALAGERATVIDVGGRLVLPGFQDAHVHVPEAGINEAVCFFPDGLTLGDYEALAVECAEQQADSPWVRAAGASLFDLRDTAESPLAALDRAVPDRPALVLDDLGHAVWTNSLGLRAAAIGPNDPDPRGGVFHRDASGELTGLLLEDAQQLVRNAAAPDDETNYRGLLIAMEQLAANGVTTVSDAGGYWGQNHPAAWQRALDEGTLTVRAANTLYLYPDLPVEEQLDEFRTRFSDDSALLRFDTAKVYVDGILDLGTAALLEPYDVAVDTQFPSGFDYFDTDQLRAYVDELHAMGYRVNFHVIGDRAVRDALDAVENIDDDPASIASRRHRTTHTYLVDDDDLARFAELGVVADFQQSADAVSTDYHEFLAEFIGNRAVDLIPTVRVVDAGATVTLSSDWDAGPLPPLGTIERCLTRDTNAVDDLATALAMHTIDAAYALGHDDVSGSIEVGKFADYVVVDRNVFDLDTNEIGDTSVLLTVMAGTVVYQNGDFSATP